MASETKRFLKRLAAQENPEQKKLERQQRQGLTQETIKRVILPNAHELQNAIIWLQRVMTRSDEKTRTAILLDLGDDLQENEGVISQITDYLVELVESQEVFKPKSRKNLPMTEISAGGLTPTEKVFDPEKIPYSKPVATLLISADTNIYPMVFAGYVDKESGEREQWVLPQMDVMITEYQNILSRNLCPGDEVEFYLEQPKQTSKEEESFKQYEGTVVGHRTWFENDPEMYLHFAKEPTWLKTYYTVVVNVDGQEIQVASDLVRLKDRQEEKNRVRNNEQIIDGKVIYVADAPIQ